MAARSPSLRTAAARAGGAARHNTHDLADARRDLAAERLAAYVTRVVAAAPPLTPAQRDRIAVLLRGSTA